MQGLYHLNIRGPTHTNKNIVLYLFCVYIACFRDLSWENLRIMSDGFT